MAGAPALPAAVLTLDAASGADPWHVNANTERILFLSDEGTTTARIGLSMTAGESVFPQTWYVNGFAVQTQQITYECNKILVNGG